MIEHTHDVDFTTSSFRWNGLSRSADDQHTVNAFSLKIIGTSATLLMVTIRSTIIRSISSELIHEIESCI